MTFGISRDDKGEDYRVEEARQARLQHVGLVRTARRMHGIAPEDSLPPALGLMLGAYVWPLAILSS